MSLEIKQIMKKSPKCAIVVGRHIHRKLNASWLGNQGLEIQNNNVACWQYKGLLHFRLYCNTHSKIMSGSEVFKKSDRLSAATLHSSASSFTEVNAFLHQFTMEARENFEGTIAGSYHKRPNSSDLATRCCRVALV